MNTPNRLHRPLFAMLGTAMLLMTGCISGSSGVSSFSSPGWSGDSAGNPLAEPAPRSSAHRELCLVRAPNIRPDSDLDASLTRLEGRSLTVKNRVDEGFVMKEAICNDQVPEGMLQDIAHLLRERGYAVTFGSSSFDGAVKRAFELFKRDNALYGDGYTLDALTHLGVDPMAWVQPRKLRYSDGWARAGS